MSSQTLAPLLRAVPRCSPELEESAESRALAGHTDGWNELARTHSRKVVLVLLSRGIQPDSARDIAQEAWARLIEQQRLGRLSSIKMPGLAIKQALYLVGDLARRSKDIVGHLADGELAGDDPHPRLWARERLAKARQVLSRCSATERAIFTALYTSPGASAEEAGRQLGLSVQRVRQIHCELRKKLRAETMGSHDE